MFFLCSCAKMGVITGGEKDTIPPSLVASIPPQNSTNVTSKEFSFLFDEVINSEEIKNKLIISPYSDIDYEVETKKNSLVLRFDSLFEVNRTYILNFADGIKDITEGNEAKTLKYVFSTGSVLDSLVLSGYVKDPLTNELQKEILVSLYDSDDSLGLFNDKPLYFDYTNDSGFFQIENIKSGFYSLYAFNDKNMTFKAEPDREAYGFLNKKINLSKPRDTVFVSLIKQNLIPIRIINSRNRGLYYDVTFTRYVDKLSLAVDTKINYSLNDNNKTLRFYPEQKYVKSEERTNDSLLVYITAYDSLSNFVKDTVYLSFNESNRSKTTFEAKGFPLSSSSIDDTLFFNLTFSKPVSFFNDSLVFSVIDTLYKKPVSLYKKVWNENKTQIDFGILLKKDSLAKWKKESVSKINNDSLNYVSDSVYSVELNYFNSLNINKVSFLMDYGSLISIEKDTLKRKVIPFEFKDDEYYGMISGKVETKLQNYYIELVSKDFNNSYINNALMKDLFVFKNITPGSYFIRAVVDENMNGVWDKGNIIKNIEPEKIIYFKSLVEIRSNWELDNIVFKF